MDGLDLLFRIKGDASGAKSATKETQQAIAALRGVIGTDFGAMSTVATNALGKISSSIQNLVAQTPVIGNALNSLTNDFIKMAGATGEGAGELAALAGPLAVAAVGVGALSAAVVIVAKEIFDLTKQTADWQGKLFDLSQQTGLTVETLSTLELVAKTTGGSLEGVTASLGIFQKNMEAAQDPTSKQSELFRKLKIDTDNTEVALRQTLTALAAMPEGFQQTAAALELFGRGGKQVLAILKETGGDLDGATEKFRQLGLIVSTDAARAADEFNDTLAITEFQIRAVTAQIAEHSIPIVLDSLRQFSAALKENKDGVQALGDTVAVTASIISFQFVTSLKELEFWAHNATPALTALNAALKIYNTLFGQSQTIPGVPIPGGAGGPTNVLSPDTTAQGIPLPFPGTGSRAPGARAGGGGRGGGGGAGRTVRPIGGLGTVAAADLAGVIAAANKAADDFVKLVRELGEKAEEGFTRARRAADPLIADLEKMVELVREAGDKGVAGFVRLRSVQDQFTKETKGQDDSFLGAIGKMDEALAPEKFDVWKESFAGLKEIGLDALGGLAQGVGSLVENWVLLGTAGPNAMRKLVASVLAGVAAQAAVKAIYELAEGFAYLFTNPPAAAAHFQSAALFGSIATVAAVAGRGIAGNAFQQQPTAASSAGRGGAGGGTSGSTSPSALDVNRRALQPERQIIEIRFTGDLGDVIEHRWIEKYTQGGRLRNVVVSDGQG